MYDAYKSLVACKSYSLAVIDTILQAARETRRQRLVQEDAQAQAAAQQRQARAGQAKACLVSSAAICLLTVCCLIHVICSLTEA